MKQMGKNASTSPTGPSITPPWQDEPDSQNEGQNYQEPSAQLSPIVNSPPGSKNRKQSPQKGMPASSSQLCQNQI